MSTYCKTPGVDRVFVGIRSAIQRHGSPERRCGMQILARRCEDYGKYSSPFNGELLLAFRTQAQAKYRPRMLEVRRDGFRTAFQIAKQARGSSGFYWPSTVWTNSHILVSIFLSCCLHTPSRVLTTHRVGSSLRRIRWCKPCHPAACV
jgi:hypothetical protein